MSANRSANMSASMSPVLVSYNELISNSLPSHIFITVNPNLNPNMSASMSLVSVSYSVLYHVVSSHISCLLIESISTKCCLARTLTYDNP
jgi:hypothetical protein